MDISEPSPALPSPIRDRVRELVVEPFTAERLGGMSGGRVYRVRGQSRSAIVKRPARQAEVAFYRAIVPVWPRQRFTPALLDAVPADDSRWWLLLEDIPQPLPPERWHGDAELLLALARLHAAELPELPADAAPYRPDWPPAMTERALVALPASAAIAADLPVLLRAVQQMAQPLFAPRVSLSGDPNPTNWGLRDDGRLVLFDWERFCRGAPALDLAITIPGLGDAAAFRQVAERYLRVASLQTASANVLAREIALAKVWGVVEFLAFASDASSRASEHAAWVADRVVPWLLEIARESNLR